MSISPNDFISIATDDLTYNTEARDRNCISRAYYGLYHKAFDSMKHCLPTSHSGLIEYLNQPYNRKQESQYKDMQLIQLGAVLKQQKRKRQKADYKLNEEVARTEAEASLIACNKIMSAL
ncbi:hypothetical protein AB7185_07110 [Providencia rettgeri]